MPINFIPKGVVDGFFRTIGVGGILVSAAMGFAGLVIAKRVRLDSASLVFARGFLGVSAVACFGISAAMVVVSISDVKWVGPLVGSLVLLFLAIEFAIGGALYRRVHLQKGGDPARVLSVLCFALAIVIGIAAVTVFGSMFSGVPVAEAAIMLAACALAGWIVYGIEKKGLPETPGGAGKIWLIGLGAAFLCLVSGYMFSSSKSEKTGDMVFVGVVSFIGLLTVFTGWLLWRLRPGTARTALAVFCYVSGGGLCLFALLGWLGTI